MILKNLQHKIDNKTKPLGALGKLENLAIKIGTIQNTLSPKLEKPTILVFAADHGLADAGVSVYPKDVSWQMVMNFLSGGAAINVFCRQHNLNLKVIDAGVDHDFQPHEKLFVAKIKKSTANILTSPAMTEEDCKLSMQKGAEIVTMENLTGCNIIGFGEMGIGNTSAAALLMHKFTQIPLKKCIGRGTGHDDDGLKKKYEILKKASDLYPKKKSPIEILSAFGGFEIAMIAGAIIEAYKRNMIILIDGFIVTSALIAAYAINKNVLENCIFCHVSNESGHQGMLNFLGVSALLNLEMRLGEGTGAAVAFPIIDSAVRFLNEMSSFESAGVSNKD